MEAIILGNPYDIVLGSIIPVNVPAYNAEQAVIQLSDGYNPYILGSGSTDSYWFRYDTGILRPLTITDKVVIGGTSMTGTESLKVVGTILSTGLRLGSSIAITSILNEDTLVSDSAVAVPTQHSVKAYVDNQIGGYLQSGDNISELVNDVPYIITETDPIFVSSIAHSIVNLDLTHWNNAYMWGDHSLVGYLTTETDPVFLASEAYTITSTDTTHWDLAYTNQHTHTNKTLLDSIISSGDGLSSLKNNGTYGLDLLVSGSNGYIQFASSGVLGSDSSLYFDTGTNALIATNINLSDYAYFNSANVYITNITDELVFTDTISGSVTLSSLVGGATNYWTTMTGGIYYTDYVGINTPVALNEALNVNGNIEATQFNSKYYRYNGNWLVGTSIGTSLLRTNSFAFDIIDTATPLVLFDGSGRTIEFEGDVQIGTTKNLTVGYDAIIGNALYTQYIQYNTNPSLPLSHNVGLSYWNADLGTINIMSDISGCIQQVGYEIWCRVNNNTGSTILAGVPVYVTSAAGDICYIAPAKADSESTSLVTIGLTTNDIADGEEGNVTITGVVHNIPTNGLTEGALVYVSATTTGTLTSTRPVAPNNTVAIGICSVKDPVVGSIIVQLRIQPTLERLSNVYTVGKTDGQALGWVAANNRWENITIAGGTPPVANILNWDTDRYKPYATQQAFLSFDTSSTPPVLTTRLNLNGNFYTHEINTTKIVVTGNVEATIADVIGVTVGGNLTIYSDGEFDGSLFNTADSWVSVNKPIGIETQLFPGGYYGNSQLILGENVVKGGEISMYGLTSGLAIIKVASVAGTPTLTLPTTTGTIALTSDISAASPIDDILDWSTNKYTPYTSKQAGVNIYTGTTDPDGTTRVNLNGAFHSTTLTTPGLISTNYGLKVTSSTYPTLEASLDIISLDLSNTNTGEMFTLNNNQLYYYDGTVNRLLFNPRVADGASAVAYMIDTYSALSTSGAKLFSIRNNNSEKTLIDKDGSIEGGGSNFKITAEGGYAVKLTAGETLNKGEVVYFQQGGTNNNVIKNPIDGDMPIGIVYATVSSTAGVWVVISGIAEVLPNAADTAAMGYVIYSSSTTAGRVDQANTVPAAATHFKECGHFIATGTGAGVLTKAIIHFN